MSVTLLSDHTTPVRAYAALRALSGTPCFLLESAEPGARFGRYSILGTGTPTAATTSDPLAMLRGLRGGATSSVAARFAGARVGAIPYDAVHALAKVPAAHPLSGGFFFDRPSVMVFDHWTHRIELAAHDDTSLALLTEAARGTPDLPPLAIPSAPKPPLGEPLTSDGDFQAAVARAKEFVAAGDAFQIVLSRIFRAPPRRRDPLTAYRALRAFSPSPYMFLLETPEVSIAGASPETLVRKDGARVMVRPIAGTRPRGETDERDRALEEELLRDPKEIAEHVMLIDLARNDLGRISRTGSLALPRRMEVDRHAHVMHLTSEVTGEVGPGVSAEDVVRATFPAGTLSGAPKVRAMQIIHALEGRARGFYGGAVGYVTDDGDLDFAIAIRSIVFRGETAEVTAGAGIVEGSDPRAEADETRHKARAALSALALAEEAS